VARARPGEQFGAPRDLGDPGKQGFFGPRSLRAELDERGNALLVWSYFDDTDPEYEVRGPGPCCDGLRARVIRRDGTVSGVKTLAPAGNEVYLQDLHIGPTGALGIVFAVSSYTSGARSVQARFGSVGSGFGGRETVLRTAAAGPFGLAFAGRRARLTYATGSGPAYETRPTTIREIERRAARRWRRLPDRLRRVTMQRDTLRLATSERGAQAASWIRPVAGDPRSQIVSAAAREPGAAFRTRRLVSESYFNPGPPVAIEASGNALVAWPSVRRGGMVAALRRPRAGFGGVTRIGGDTPNTEVQLPAFDVNARGHGLVAWAEKPFPDGQARLVGTFRNSRGSAIEHQVIASDPRQFSYFATAVSLDRAGRGHVAYFEAGRLKVVAARIGG
jgi:hypothetical protein